MSNIYIGVDKEKREAFVAGAEFIINSLNNYDGSGCLEAEIVRLKHLIKAF